jgi:hypothetical protein
MKGLSAIALGLLISGLGIYAAAVLTPLAVPLAFRADGSTGHVVALFIMLCITQVFALFAGWVTARCVDDHRVGHAALMATCALAVAICVGAIRWAAAPPWYYVTSWLLLVPVAMLGARSWERIVKRRANAAARNVAAA